MPEPVADRKCPDAVGHGVDVGPCPAPGRRHAQRIAVTGAVGERDMARPDGAGPVGGGASVMGRAPGQPEADRGAGGVGGRMDPGGQPVPRAVQATGSPGFLFGPWQARRLFAARLQIQPCEVPAAIVVSEPAFLGVQRHGRAADSAPAVDAADAGRMRPVARRTARPGLSRCVAAGSCRPAPAGHRPDTPRHFCRRQRPDHQLPEIRQMKVRHLDRRLSAGRITDARGRDSWSWACDLACRSCLRGARS